MQEVIYANSNCPDRKKFCQMVRGNPLMTFVNARFGGRLQDLSVTALLDEGARASTLVVLGADWRVHLCRDRGRILAIDLKVRKSRRDPVASN